MNFNTSNVNEEVSSLKYLTHGIHKVKLKEVVKAVWSGGLAFDAFFVDAKGLEYKHRFFEFKGKEDLKSFKGESISVETQWSRYLAYIKHIFNKCFKHAYYAKFDILMSKVNSFETLIVALNSLASQNTEMFIKLVDDGKGYAKFPKYINGGFCDWVDTPQYNLTFDETKEGKKQKENTEQVSSINAPAPWESGDELSF